MLIAAKANLEAVDHVILSLSLSLLLGNNIITGGPGRGPVTDVASPYEGGANSNKHTYHDRAGVVRLVACLLSPAERRRRKQADSDTR